MIERLINIENRYNEITQELLKSEVISDIKKTLSLTKQIMWSALKMLLQRKRAG